jgi:hypothetical protein
MEKTTQPVTIVPHNVKLVLVNLTIVMNVTETESILMSVLVQLNT